MLTRCVYTSIPSRTGRTGVIEDILRVARPRNAEFRITGFLLRSETFYLQFIEGPSAHIDQLMINIRKDSRHQAVVELPFTFGEARAFPEWSMGYTTTVGEEQFVQAVRGLGPSMKMDRIADRLKAIQAIRQTNTVG